MKECNVNIIRIASNLTSDEFKGYCKGLSLHWLFKSLDGNSEAGKRVLFWGKAYRKYKHNYIGD